MIRTLVAAALLATTAAPALAQPAHSAAPALPADTRFTVTVEGSGPDVILIPGLSSPRAVWDGAKRALGGKCRLHLVELNGFGGSAPGANLDGKILDTAVDQLAAYITANHLKAPAVVGHSMGGLMGLMLARRHPEAVGKLMVVDALPFIGEIFAPGATVAQVEPQARMMRDMMAASFGKPASPAVTAQIAATNALKPASQAQVAAWVVTADPRITAQAMYEDMTTDFRPEMAKITTPVTLLYPWAEARVPKERADALYRAAYAPAKNVTYVPVADSGHFIMLDQPAAFGAALTAFLK